MTATRRKSRSIQTEQSKTLLDSFAMLFYVCKILGLNSQEWTEFRIYRHLKKSSTGDVLVVIAMIISFVNFNIMIIKFLSINYLVTKNPLTIGIGFILSYYSLALFISDRINALLKQNEFANIFMELEAIDDDLRDFNMVLNNNIIKYYLVMGIFLAILLESITFSVTFTFYVDKVNWSSWLFIYGYVPSFFNTLDKLWYMGIITAIRKRFEVINHAFDMEALRLAKKNTKIIQNKKLKKAKKYCSKNQIAPVVKNLPSVFGDVVINPPIFSASFDGNIYAATGFACTYSDSSTSTAPTSCSLEEKFNTFCQIHDSLCDVAQHLNKVYAFPNLMQMGYGFCTVTAQLYFLYSYNVEQEIPSMFRTAYHWSIAFIYILYILSKCISILYGNWVTNLESKRTGICIHRCAMAADNNDTYEMINHLSLKLFNHQSEFNACGYFPLSMRTLFHFCGGITTYLIILIQFNLEEQQVKFNSENGKQMALKPNAVLFAVVNGTRSANMTSLLNIFYQIWKK